MESFKFILYSVLFWGSAIYLGFKAGYSGLTWIDVSTQVFIMLVIWDKFTEGVRKVVGP